MNWDATQDTHIEAVDSVTIRGYRYSNGWARNQKVYFCTRFSRPFTQMSVDTVNFPREDKGYDTGLVARFDYPTQEGEQITLVTAISGTSWKQKPLTMISTPTCKKQRRLGIRN